MTVFSDEQLAHAYDVVKKDFDRLTLSMVRSGTDPHGRFAGCQTAAMKALLLDDTHLSPSGAQEIVSRLGVYNLWNLAADDAHVVNDAFRPPLAESEYWDDREWDNKNEDVSHHKGRIGFDDEY